MKQFALPVPRRYWWRVSMSRMVYVEPPRSALDDMPILHFEPAPDAKPFELAKNCRVVIEEASPLNNQCFLLDIPIITYRQLWRLFDARQHQEGAA